MVNYILLSIFREFKIIKDPLVFYIFAGSISITLIFLLITTGLIMNNFLFFLIINFLLFQYNMPLIIKILQSDIVLHYLYSTKVRYKYIMFVCLKNNPMLIIAMLFNLLMVILTLNKIYLLLAVIISVLMQIHIFYNQLIKNNFIKCLQGLVILLTILLNIYTTNYAIEVISIVILIFTILILEYQFKILYPDLNYDSNKRYKKTGEIQFNNFNMYFKLLQGFFRRFSFKNYLILLFISLLYIALIKKTHFYLNISSILVFLYLFDLELLADQQFNEIDKTAAHFNFLKLSPLNRINTFMLSEQFHRSVVYIIILFGFAVIELNIKKIIETFIIVILMSFLGIIYYFITEKVVMFRKKINSIFFQYIIILIVISVLAFNTLFFN